MEMTMPDLKYSAGNAGLDLNCKGMDTTKAVEVVNSMRRTIDFLEQELLAAVPEVRTSEFFARRQREIEELRTECWECVKRIKRAMQRRQGLHCGW